ncbi:hypothetical protein [Actinomadura fulvescens]
MRRGPALSRRRRCRRRVGRHGIDAAVRYLTGHAGHLRYDQALAAGWPIPTGLIEGAVGHIVGDRLEITGARWGLAGAEAVLTLQAVIANGDLPAYWDHHLTQERRRGRQRVR